MVSDINAYSHVFKQKRIEVMRSYFSLMKRLLDHSLEVSDQLPSSWPEQVHSVEMIEKGALRYTGIGPVAKFNPGSIFDGDRWNARQYRDAIETIRTIQNRIDAYYPPPHHFRGSSPDDPQHRERWIDAVRTKWFARWDKAAEEIKHSAYFGS